MHRRTFLLSTATAGAAAATGAGFWRWQDITTRTFDPGRSIGHRLRDAKPGDWPAPSAEYATDVAIVGGGIAGLTAAWRLAREGHTRFALIVGPEAHGNAASGETTIGGERLRFPTGAHYLPLPSMESTHVREMLVDFGVCTGGASTATPTYDERVVVHAPDERLYRDGRWHDGIVPGDDGGGRLRGRDSAAAGDPRGPEAAEADPRGRTAAAAGNESQTDRFFARIDVLRDARGVDGRKVFAVPIALASTDPRWTALDRMSFAAWLDAERFDDAALRWYLDYCCRDDYGADAAAVSAWAGLHYFAARNGRASNAERGAVLTWPEGLGALAARLDGAAFRARPGRPAPRRLAGTALSVRETPSGVDVVCAHFAAGVLSTYVVHARRAICAMPLFVARHVVPSLADHGYDAARDAPTVAPWLVANFAMNRFPDEADGVPLAWDNVVFGSGGLGYVVSTHQDIRMAPSASTVFTAYRALSDRSPADARRWLDRASPAELGDVAAADLRDAYGWRLAPCVDRVDVTLRGHAMATPVPGTLANRGLAALRDADGAILFAHADLSGYSVFEEAAWWGVRAADRVLG